MPDQENQIAGELKEFFSIPVVQRILRDLDEQLDPKFCYHSPAHTREVIREGIGYGFLDGLSREELRMIAIAAAFHDAGFLHGSDNHEEKSAEIAKRYMSEDSEFSRYDIGVVEQMILDTRVSMPGGTYWRPPRHTLSRYLLDADVSNLGRKDFFEKTELLCVELHAEPTAFFRQALKFLENHRWFTLPAKQLRQSKKEDNLVLLRRRLGEEEPLSQAALEFVSTLPSRLSPPEGLFAEIPAIVEELRVRLDADDAVFLLGTEQGGRIGFRAIAAETAEKFTIPSLFEDTRLATWIVEPTSDPHGDELEIITIPIPPFAMDTSGFLRILGVSRSERKFHKEDISFLERCAEVFSLALSAFFHSLEYGRRSTGLKSSDSAQPESKYNMRGWAQEFEKSLNDDGESQITIKFEGDSRDLPLPDWVVPFQPVAVKILSWIFSSFQSQPPLTLTFVLAEESVGIELEAHGGQEGAAREVEGRASLRAALARSLEAGMMAPAECVSTSLFDETNWQFFQYPNHLMLTRSGNGALKVALAVQKSLG